MDTDKLLDGYQDGFEGLEDVPLQINESRARGMAEQEEAQRLSTLTEDELYQEQQQSEIDEAVSTESALPDLTSNDLPLAGIAGAVDNVLGTDIQGAYVDAQNEGRADSASRNVKSEQTLYSGPLSTVAAETTRAVVGGRAGLVESVGETGELALDTVSTWLGLADEELLTDDISLEDRIDAAAVDSAVRATMFRLIPNDSPMAYQRISSSYGSRTNPISGKRHVHTGIDLTCKRGEDIVAPADGVIETVRPSKKGFTTLTR